MTRGAWQGTVMQTTVDSEFAKYYLEEYMAGVRTHPDWDAAIDHIHASLENNLPTASQLQEWTRLYSLDFTTMLLARQLELNAVSRPLVSAYRKELERIRQSDQPPAGIDSASDYFILCVPGWLYKDDSPAAAAVEQHLKVLRNVGFHVTYADIEENGTVERNAELVVAEIRRLSHTYEKIILLSASKAGPEVALALTRLRDTPEVHSVKAWVNVGGTLKGTPMADAALSWPTSWFVSAFILRGKSFDAIESLETGRSLARFRNFTVPAHVVVINYVGLPLSGQVTETLRYGYAHMHAGGPNDGVTYVTDAIAPNSVTIPELGADHLFVLPDVNSRIVALGHAVVQYLSSGAQERAAADASPPAAMPAAVQP
jgi:hypothetical protein